MLLSKLKDVFIKSKTKRLIDKKIKEFYEESPDKFSKFLNILSSLSDKGVSSFMQNDVNIAHKLSYLDGIYVYKIYINFLDQDNSLELIPINWKEDPILKKIFKFKTVSYVLRESDAIWIAFMEWLDFVLYITKRMTKFKKTKKLKQDIRVQE